MYCPHFILINRRWLWVMIHTRADVDWKYVTAAEKLNPLRYEIEIGPRVWRRKNAHPATNKRRLISWNEGAKLNRKFANLRYKLFGGRS